MAGLNKIYKQVWGSKGSTPVLPPWVIIPEDLGDASIGDWADVGAKYTGDRIKGVGSLVINAQLGMATGCKFGEFNWDLEGIDNIDLIFKINSATSGYGIFFDNVSGSGVAPFHQKVRMRFKDFIFSLSDSSSNLIDSTSVAYGDEIKINIRQGKVEVFVNNVSSAEYSDVLISFDTYMSQFTTSRSFSVSDVRQIMYKS